MKQITFLTIALVSFLIISCSNSDSPTTDDYETDLNSVIQTVGSSIKTIDSNMQVDVQFLIQNECDSLALRTRLKNYLLKNKHIEEYCYIDSSLILKYIEPSKYYSFEGYNLSEDNSSKNYMLKNKKFISDAVFKAAEGYWASCIMQPIFKNNKYVGAFDCLFKPEVMLKDIITKRNCEMWVMEKGGRQLYDYDSTEIGDNIITSDFTKQNPKLLTAVKLIDSLQSGSSSYEFNDEHNGQLVKKICHWKTYSNEGIEWRFIWVKRVN